MATSISDIPFEDGKTDFKTDYYVDGLVHFINGAETPLTVALQGEWGSGKTSLMSRLHRRLCNDKNSAFIGVSINTWEYSMLSTPEETVYNILVRLVKDISKNDDGTKKTLKRFLRGTGNFLYRGGRELVKAVPVAGHTLGAVVEALDVPAQNPFYTDNNDQAALSELRKSLEKAVKQRIADDDNKKGIIVFVDDLDRLNPPVAVEILELFKNIFTLQNCIFILAIDYEVVVKGLEPKFGKLTHENEREFRSFFDKIIQVPFSLPVNSYQPMDFVMRSLKEIGYISAEDNMTEEQKDSFSEVVEASVGNNPRSIKRLINTLSLLNCITKAKQQSEWGINDACEDVIKGKLLNFIIVAIQICYPRIYTLLTHKPNFKEWDTEFATREGIKMDGNGDETNWADFLEALCTSDAYLSQRHPDISKLFRMIIDCIGDSNANEKERIGLTLREILNNASVTGVRTDIRIEDFDKKAFIRKLHANVGSRIRQLRPDIESLETRNNTGNGGFKFTARDGHRYDIKFAPHYNSADNSTTLTLEMSTRIRRSEDCLGLSLEELLKNTRLAHALSVLDSKIAPLLNVGVITSQVTKEGRFKSYSEELRALHEEGSMSGDVTHDARYSIALHSPSEFEDMKIVDTIADVVIANYDFITAAMAE